MSDKPYCRYYKYDVVSARPGFDHDEQDVDTLQLFTLDPDAEDQYEGLRLRLYCSPLSGNYEPSHPQKAVYVVARGHGPAVAWSTRCSSGPTPFFDPRKTEEEEDQQHSWQDMAMCALSLDLEAGDVPAFMRSVAAELEYVRGCDFTGEEMGTRAWLAVPTSKEDAKYVLVAMVSLDGDTLLDILNTHYTDYSKAMELVRLGELRGMDDDGTPDVFNDPWPPVQISRALYGEKGGAAFNYLYIVGSSKPWRCVKGREDVDEAEDA